jgi:sugar phosphate isomerase/epimerase
MAFSYSVQLFSVRSVLAQDPLGTLRKIKQMGYNSVEGFGNFNYSSSEINYGMADSGLKMISYHVPWANVQDDKLSYTMSFLKEVGCKYIIVPGLPKECTSSIDAWKRTAEKFNAILKQVQDGGMYLGYHNHSSEFQMLEGQLPFTVFFDNTDPAIVMQMDNGNAMHGNGNVMEMMKRYPGRARSVHLKPYSKDGGYGPIIGKDDINWGEFLHWCRDKGGTEHYIVEYEDEKTHPQMEGVELCIKALKELEAAGKI